MIILKQQRRWVCGSMWPHTLSRGLLAAVILAGIGNVAGVHVYTEGTVEARNGTERRLKCTFQSSSPVGKRTTVTWSFRPDNGDAEEVVSPGRSTVAWTCLPRYGLNPVPHKPHIFGKTIVGVIELESTETCPFAQFIDAMLGVSVLYYLEQPYATSKGRFKERVVWSGNIWRKDVSITITDLQFSDNGTFMCAVLNPPDVDLVFGEIKLSVVHKVTYSEMLILGIVIGGATGLVLVVMFTMVIVQLCRKPRDIVDVEEMKQDPQKGELGYRVKDGTEMEKLNGEMMSFAEDAKSARVP